MKFLGRTQPLAKHSILDCLEVIKRLGFDGVEICLELDDMDPATLDPPTIAGIQDKVHELALAPHSISYHVDYVYDDLLFDRSKKAIALTPDFGADTLVFSGPWKRDNDPGAWSAMVARTRELARIAQDHGVTLAQEFEPNFLVGSTADLLRLFEEVDSPNLAANMDLGHVFLCDPDPIDAIRQVGDRIVHCHIEDMKTGVHDHMLPPEGDMDLRQYLQALHDIGFQGGLSLDLYKHDYEAVAPGALAHFREILVEIER